MLGIIYGACFYRIQALKKPQIWRYFIYKMIKIHNELNQSFGIVFLAFFDKINFIVRLFYPTHL